MFLYVSLTQPLRIVGFYGDGYLEHDSFTFRKIHSVLSFSFRTMQETAMLLLSTFEGREDKLSDNLNQEAKVRPHYYVNTFWFFIIKKN